MLSSMNKSALAADASNNNTASTAHIPSNGSGASLGLNLVPSQMFSMASNSTPSLYSPIVGASGLSSPKLSGNGSQGTVSGPSLLSGVSVLQRRSSEVSGNSGVNIPRSGVASRSGFRGPATNKK